MNGSVSLWRLGDATLVAHWAVPEDMLKAAPLGSPLRLPMPQAAVRSLSFSGDERALALGYANGTIGIRRVPSGETVREIKAHTNSVMPMETSRDGRWLATASQDGLVRVWDWATGALQAVFASPNKAGVHPSLAFRPDNSLVVGNVPIYTRPTQPFAFLWDWRSNRTVSSVVIRSITPSLGMSIAINPVDGRIAMGGGGVGSAVSIWDPELRRETGRLVGTARPVTSLDFSPDGERLVTAGDGVRVWSTDRLELLAMLDVPGDFVQFTRDGRRLIAGSTRISVLDSRAPSSPIRQLVLNPRTPPNTVRVSPRPNLSGAWVLAEIVGEPSFPGAPAKALEIAQTPETLDVADATAVASYRLDGTESIIRQPTKDGVADQVARATVEPDAIVTIVSTASGEHRLRYYLDGDQLVIEGDGGKRVYRRGR
jgi:WD40 repeat protein